MNRTREASDRSDADATLAKNSMIMMVRTCGCSIPSDYQIAFELDCFVVADTRPSCQSCRETESLLAGRIEDEEIKKMPREAVIQMACKSSRNVVSNFIGFARQMTETPTRIPWLAQSVPVVIRVLDGLMRRSSSYTTDETLLDGKNPLGEQLQELTGEWGRRFSTQPQGSCGKRVAVSSANGDVILEQMFVTFGYLNNTTNNCQVPIVVHP
jgi:hypothetical protein